MDKTADDIFNEKNKVTGNWMKFEKVGDRIKGTLVSTRNVINSLSGNNQTIYELLTEDGEYWNIGGKPGIDAQMKRVKLGQIVGFEFVEERKSTRPGYNATKIIQVYANPNVVNEEWLKEQNELKAVAPEEEVPEVDIEDLGNDEPFPSGK